jgi:hypothetical protein
MHFSDRELPPLHWLPRAIRPQDPPLFSNMLKMCVETYIYTSAESRVKNFKIISRKRALSSLFGDKTYFSGQEIQNMHALRYNVLQCQPRLPVDILDEKKTIFFHQIFVIMMFEVEISSRFFGVFCLGLDQNFAILATFHVHFSLLYEVFFSDSI